MTNYEIKVLEIGMNNKRPIYSFKGGLNGFDIKKFQKRINDIMDTKYVMRCSLAAFCYGVYVRLLF